MDAIEDLIRARDNLAAIIAQQTDRWLATGCPPSFSVDGESYDWNSWLQSKNDALSGINQTIAQMRKPFVLRSRGRA